MASSNKYVSSSTVESQLEDEDKEMARISNSVSQYLKAKSDVKESNRRVNLGKTSNKEFNDLHKKWTEEQRKSRCRKRKVTITDFKATNESLKEVEVYLTNCSGCAKCFSLNHKEKIFMTKLCKLPKSK